MKPASASAVAIDRVAVAERDVVDPIDQPRPGFAQQFLFQLPRGGRPLAELVDQLLARSRRRWAGIPTGNAASGAVFVLVVMVTYNCRRAISVRLASGFAAYYYSTFQIVDADVDFRVVCTCPADCCERNHYASNPAIGQRQHRPHDCQVPGRLGRLPAARRRRRRGFARAARSSASTWKRSQLDAAECRRSSTRRCDGCDAVISALSFHFNAGVAQAALRAGDQLFRSDRRRRDRRGASARSPERARPGQIFMPQCGLAPGFISIVAHHLTESFDTLDTVLHARRRAAAVSHQRAEVQSHLVDRRLINEYCNPCEAIHDGRRIDVLPLEGLEQFSLDGVRYEAFNTSGGLGTLCETLDGRVRELNYKTIRYVGHRDLMALLVNELRLSERREMLKDILENAVPVTFQDVVVIVLHRHRPAASGQLVQISDARKIYHQTIDGETWSAIQITTPPAICAVLDLHFAGQAAATSGFVRQEQVDLDTFLANRFGRYYQHAGRRSQPQCDSQVERRAVRRPPMLPKLERRT